MSHTLTDTSGWAGVVVPDDSDSLNAASVVQGFQPLANRTLYLKGAYKLNGLYRLVGNPAVPGGGFNTLKSWSDTAYTPAHDYTLATISLVAGSTDVLIVRAKLVAYTTAQDSFYGKLRWAYDSNATADFPEGAPTILFTPQVNSQTYTATFSTEGLIALSNAITTQLVIKVSGASLAGSTWNLLDATSLTVERWTPTP